VTAKGRNRSQSWGPGNFRLGDPARGTGSGGAGEKGSVDSLASETENSLQLSKDGGEGSKWKKKK